MSDPSAYAPAPVRRWPWLAILLIASLALNLLVGGAIAARFMFPERVERLTGAVTQILPRRFLADLPRERRKELMAVIRSYRGAFQDGRTKLREAALGLADTLDADPYDTAKTASAVATIEQAGQAMLTDGAKLANDLIGRLSPEERKSLAQRLRDRAGRKKQ
jgi:uncharacterized membrane protein